MFPTRSQLLRIMLLLAFAGLAGCGPKAGEQLFPNHACIGVADFNCTPQDAGTQDGGSGR